MAAILFAAVLWTAVRAQNFTSGSASGAYDNEVLMCNTTFKRANGTGIFSFNPEVPQGTTQGSYNPEAPAVSWVRSYLEASSLADLTRLSQ